MSNRFGFLRRCSGLNSLWDEDEYIKAGIATLLSSGEDVVDSFRMRYRSIEKVRLQERLDHGDFSSWEKYKFRRYIDPKFDYIMRLRAKRLNHTLRPYWEWLCHYLDHRCQMCGERFDYFDLSVDHIKPLSKGGVNRWWNIQPLCRPCNSRKGNGYFIGERMKETQDTWRAALKVIL